MRKIFLILLLSVVIFSCDKKHDVATCHCPECMDIKIGQMMVAGFRGTEPTPYVTDAIRKFHLGGVIYFDLDVSNDMGVRNVESPEQLAALSESLQRLVPKDGHKLFVAIDQEGGVVNRLKAVYGFPQSVSAAYLGRIGCEDSTRSRAKEMAEALQKAGVNIDFAPCVDLAINPSNPIIAGKERAFSASADSVMLHSRIFVEEMNNRSILTSLKHFPGHGSSENDSHLGLVDITDCWSDCELEPYSGLVSEGYRDIVMVGHLINRNVDSLPASLSEKFIDGMLRKELGFDGVIATDDMNMGAIVQNYSLERALSLAINAGVNMIIMGNNAPVYEENLVERSHGIIKQLVNSGEIAPEKIDESYCRIVELKSRLR